MEKQRINQRLAEIEHDIAITKEQIEKFEVCPVNDHQAAKVFADRERVLREQLQDLHWAKLDAERHLKELEE